MYPLQWGYEIFMQRRVALSTKLCSQQCASHLVMNSRDLWKKVWVFEKLRVGSCMLRFFFPSSIQIEGWFKGFQVNLWQNYTTWIFLVHIDTEQHMNDYRFRVSSHGYVGMYWGEDGLVVSDEDMYHGSPRLVGGVVGVVVELHGVGRKRHFFHFWLE